MASSDSAAALPKVTCLLTPPPGRVFSQSPGIPNGASTSDSLVLNVAKVMGDLAQAVKPFIVDSRLVSLEVTRAAKMAAMPKPVPLYFKVGFI